ncbi:uncharacterized protein LOC122089764 [Macadamia integrifolia]|uniref:uncharacterized protein LOC122089764 n=1 Tax=Macadamia integrifolia TaxID=60698 RepID=UPI001C4F3085|nr:uncharacterized protein LOC122089764 [Macadamia integrifolia]
MSNQFATDITGSSSDDDDMVIAHQFQNMLSMYRMREPLNDSSYTGPVRVAEVLAGHADVCYQEFRLERHVFLSLRDRLVHRGWLVDNRFIRVDEQLAMFLMIVGQGLSNRQMQCRFNHSGQMISAVFHTVLQAMLNLSLETIRTTNFDVVPLEITNNPKYYPYFKDCIGAIDGTHISAIVPRLEETRYHNRKGKYYVVDLGYASQLGYLVPFRGQRYHLQDYGEGRPGPRTAKELFNHKHSSLRNVIERTFGVLKNRFHILKSMKAYDIEDQSRIVVTCCGIHNYIKEQAIQDQLFNEVGGEQNIDDPMNPDTRAYHTSASDVPRD